MTRAYMSKVTTMLSILGQFPEIEVDMHMDGDDTEIIIPKYCVDSHEGKIICGYVGGMGYKMIDYGNDDSTTFSIIIKP